MGTAYYPLSVGTSTPPDNTTGNLAPAISRLQGTEANPKKHKMQAAFDPAADEHLWYNFIMPGDYVSGGEVLINWMTNDVGAGESAVWGVRLGAITPADADTPVEHATAAASTTTTDVNTTEANRLIQTAITVANLDGVQADDEVDLCVFRDADNAADDLSSDAMILSARFKYTN